MRIVQGEISEIFLWYMPAERDNKLIRDNKIGDLLYHWQDPFWLLSFILLSC